MKLMLQLAKSEAFYCSLVKEYISLVGKIDLLSLPSQNPHTAHQLNMADFLYAYYLQDKEMGKVSNNIGLSKSASLGYVPQDRNN